MSHSSPDGQSTFDQLPPSAMMWVNKHCDEFEQSWLTYGSLESFIDGIAWTFPTAKSILLEELLTIDIQQRSNRGIQATAEDYAIICDTFSRQQLSQIIKNALAADQTLAPATSPSSSSEPQLHPGQQLGDYTISKLIASGGMGQVYLAQHRLMNRSVAIKVMNQEVRHDSIAQKRFLREVQSLAKLSHPNIVAAFDARQEHDQMYLVTEWIDGLNLDQLIKRDGTIDVNQAVKIAVDIAQSLRYAHSMGVIHRDVKPSNVLVSADGNVKVLDLGLSRLLLPDESSTHGNLTQSRWILGTTAFMSPEQARNPLQADQRTDVYGLGCTLFYMLSGQIPYPGETPIDILVAQSSQPIPELCIVVPKIDEGLSAIVRQMMAKELDDRMPTMADVIERLTEWKLRSPLTSTRPIPHQSMFRRHLFALSGIAASAFLAWAFRKQFGMPNSSADVGAVGLVFNGQSSYAQVTPFPPTLSEGSTIAVDVTPDAGTYPANVVTWAGEKIMVVFVDEQQRWGIGLYDGAISYLNVSDVRLTMGQSQSIIASYDGSDTHLAINGHRVPTTRRDYLMSPTDSTLCLGGMPPGLFPLDKGTRFFAGLIHRVSIYSQPIANLQSDSNADSILASFEFIGASGSVVTDNSVHHWQAKLHDCSWL